MLLHKTVAKQVPIGGKLNLFAGISLLEVFSGAERMDLQQPWPLSRPSPRTSAHGRQQCDHRELWLGSRVSLSGQNSRCLSDCLLVRLILFPWDTKGNHLLEITRCRSYILQLGSQQ